VVTGLTLLGDRIACHTAEDRGGEVFDERDLGRGLDRAYQTVEQPAEIKPLVRGLGQQRVIQVAAVDIDDGSYLHSIVA
jgi:hypothetical protein